jgi:hypothetical protein
VISTSYPPSCKIAPTLCSMFGESPLSSLTSLNQSPSLLYFSSEGLTPREIALTFSLSIKFVWSWLHTPRYLSSFNSIHSRLLGYFLFVGYHRSPRVPSLKARTLRPPISSFKVSTVRKCCRHIRHSGGVPVTHMTKAPFAFLFIFKPSFD